MPGVDQRQVSAVSARLGEVALDPSLWPEIMEEIAQAVGATAAALLQFDVRTPDVPRSAGAEDMIDYYFKNNWHTRDLRARGIPLLLRGEKTVITDQDAVTAEEMSRAPYYNEVLFRFGLPWFAAIGFQAGSAGWVLSIYRTARQGVFEADEERLLAQFAPRLTEVATLSTAVGRSVISGITNALDLVRQAALVLDRTGQVLGTNAAAEGMFDDNIRVRNRRLFLYDPKARADLDALTDQLRTTSDTAELSATPIVVRRQDRSPVLIKVSLVPAAARAPFLGARALLTLADLEPPPGPDLTVIARAFGLTRAEAKLARLMATGLAPSAAARQLGISPETARNQLKAVFAKLGTHRQGGLVALLSRIR
jgi:DNA-binding CsgD family transcriptional regulator